jgi:hypothetical protein
MLKLVGGIIRRFNDDHHRRAALLKSHHDIDQDSITLLAISLRSLAAISLRRDRPNREVFFGQLRGRSVPRPLLKRV